MNPFGRAPSPQWYLVEFWGSCFAASPGDAVQKVVGKKQGWFTVRRLEDDKLFRVSQ